MPRDARPRLQLFRRAGGTSLAGVGAGAGGNALPPGCRQFRPRNQPSQRRLSIEILEETLPGLGDLLKAGPDHRDRVSPGRCQPAVLDGADEPAPRAASEPADYMLTGSWGDKAVQEARRQGKVHVAWDGAETNYDRLPAARGDRPPPGRPTSTSPATRRSRACSGRKNPTTGDVPLVCDCFERFPVAAGRCLEATG